MESHFRVEAFDGALTCAWLLEVVGGRVVAGSTPCVVQGITTDSRLVQQHDLFIPIRGKTSDGHVFWRQAVRQGASMVLCERGVVDNMQTVGTPLIVEVEDTMRALGDIAAAWRKRFPLDMLAITGSNGKTTTKEIVASILRTCGDPLVTWRNWNNMLGLPLTLLNLRATHSVAIVEMGMNAFGEIRRLAEIAQPNYRLITNIMPVHLEALGDLNGVARAKLELVESTSPEDCFIANLDDPRLADAAGQMQCRVVTTSRNKPTADIGIERVEPLGIEGYRGVLRLPDGTLDFEFALAGEHNLDNLVAGTAAAYAMGASHEAITEGVRLFRAARMRSEWVELAQKVLVYNDCYNANPASMEVALKTVWQNTTGRKVAFLGDMGELGDYREEGHRLVLAEAYRLGFDRVVGVGPLFKSAIEAEPRDGVFCAPTSADACSAVVDVVRPGDTVLVKGSRSMEMERVTEVLRAVFSGGQG